MLDFGVENDRLNKQHPMISTSGTLMLQQIVANYARGRSVENLSNQLKNKEERKASREKAQVTSLDTDSVNYRGLATVTGCFLSR